jgi:hypothetical protein
MLSLAWAVWLRLIGLLPPTKEVRYAKFCFGRPIKDIKKFTVGHGYESKASTVHSEKSDPVDDSDVHKAKKLKVKHSDDGTDHTLDADESTSAMPSTAVSADPIVQQPPKNNLGDFGRFAVEVRRSIYEYAIDIQRPVTFKACCTLRHTIKQKKACPKHGAHYQSNSGRFNLLFVCKGIRQEAMEVMYKECELNITTEDFMTVYLKDTRSLNARTPTMWLAIFQFKWITIQVPPEQIYCSNPARFTDRLHNIAMLLCKHTTSEHANQRDRSRIIHLGALFSHAIPFNVATQGTSDWFGDDRDHFGWQSKYQSHNYLELAKETAHNLKRLVDFIGISNDVDAWVIFVNKYVDKRDIYGLLALDIFIDQCDHNGVYLFHTDLPVLPGLYAIPDY